MPELVTNSVNNALSQDSDRLLGHDTNSERERLNQEALFEAFEVYVHRKRVRPYISEFHTSYDELKTLSGAEANQKLVEVLGGREPGAELDRPAMTVCIPVAVQYEDPDRILKSMDIISRAQSSLGRPVEVVLWANAKYKADDEASVVEDAQDKYRNIKDALKERNYSGLTLKAALQILPEEEATMSKIRSNYMEAVALEALDGDYGFDHPVMWLDADITSLSPGSFKDIERAVKGFDAAVVHTNTHYSVDWLKDRSFKGMDDVTKAIVIGELLRRQIARGNPRADYLEESGLAFALGTYLSVGGVDTMDPVNEAGSLRRRITYMGPGVVPGFLRTPVYDVIVLPKTHMGLSARRHYELVKKHGPKVMANYNSVDNGEGYTLFSDMSKDGIYESYPVAERPGELDLALDSLRVRLTRGDPDQSRRDLAGMKKRDAMIDDLLDKHFPILTEDTIE